jgi:hypothetical protein
MIFTPIFIKHGCIFPEIKNASLRTGWHGKNKMKKIT